jgi:hypothetical protein
MVMEHNPRKFEVGRDPFGRMWTAELRWLQNAISIRHADAVDVKFELKADDGSVMERVVSLNHPDLLEVAKRLERPISDPWCIRLAGEHLRRVVTTWEDAEKVIITPSLGELEEHGRKTQPTALSAR